MRACDRRVMGFRNVLLLALITSACGEGSSNTPSPAAPTRTLYVVHRNATNTEPDRLAGYRIDPDTGRLTEVPGSPYTLAAGRVHGVTVDPSNRFVYVSTSVPANVHAFRRDTDTGALTPVTGSPFRAAVAGDYRSPTFDPSGRFLYVTDPLIEAIVGFRLDDAQGTLSSLGRPVDAVNNVDGAVVAPSGRFLYATASSIVSLADPTRGYAQAYAIDRAGLLTRLGDPLPAGENTQIPVIQPNGSFLYAPNADTNDISGYAVDTAKGTLTPLAHAPYAAGLGTVALALTPSGRYLYAVNARERTVDGFSIDAASGDLRAVGPSMPGGGSTPGSIVVEPGGRFLYFVDAESAALMAYAIDANTGRLTPARESSIATAARPLAVATTHE